MTTVKEIEKAISKLRDKELSTFRSWFEKFEAKRWDDSFEQDALSGKLDSIAAKAISNHRLGKSSEL